MSTSPKRSLREVPAVDFSKYEVRRNRFAMRVKTEGIDVIHDGPSAESLAAIPEIDFAAAPPRPRGRRAIVDG